MLESPDPKGPRDKQPFDPESLAALAEGCLEGEKRERTVRSLWDSARARELFADIVAVTHMMRTRGPRA